MAESDEVKTDLKDIKNLITQLSQEVAVVKAINERHENLSASNNRKLDQLDSEFQQAKGVIGFLKYFGVTALGLLAAYCVSLSVTDKELSQRVSQAEQHIAIIEKTGVKNAVNQ